MSLRQSLVPTELLGRVAMAHEMVIAIGAALGAATAGFTAHPFGLRAPFYGGAVLLFASSLISTRSVQKAAQPSQNSMVVAGRETEAHRSTRSTPTDNAEIH
ncbi:hypothetical protein OTB20_41295 [Streptomyces sp. H27-H1]|uniref:hypothetical protein n=1 Tax=Streptomyces sp. H27-H1 TaxID=2996461 RepID=UPI00226F0CC0|nr:hypothetical protein [Streptomyces sp. H27-H1]MCY0932466.1 hypothetical protein [Streptomyces sp. H27-H1]